MVQALFRQNGTGPYSGSGSTKAKLAPSSSFSPRPTFRRRPAKFIHAHRRRHSKRPPQFLSPIVVSARGPPSKMNRTPVVATRRKYHGNDLPRPGTQQTFGTNYW